MEAGQNIKDELIALFTSQDRSSDDSAMTVGEIIVATQKSDKAVYKILKMLRNEGKVVCIKVKREAIDGHMATVPAYRLKESQESLTQT
jgi:hypothetical protein